MCGHVRRIITAAPPFIKNADVAKEHVNLLKRPPFSLDGLEEKWTLTNLFITVTWSDMRAVIWTLMLADRIGHIAIIDEQELIAAYVGGMGKSQKSSDFTGLIYNNISDLVSPPALAIIRLGTLSNKNKAAPGVVMDAIRARVDYGKPTWLLCDVNDEDRPSFHPFCNSYSEDLVKLISSHFRTTTIPRINKKDGDIVQDFMARISPVSLDPDPRQQQAPPERRTEPEKRRGPKIGHDPEAEPERRPRREEKPEDDGVGNLGSVYGVGVSNSKTKFRK